MKSRDEVEWKEIVEMTRSESGRSAAGLEETAVVKERRQGSRLGRRRDHTLDAKILDATVEVLAEVGYEGMTMDMVAVRAGSGKATLYRRWSSKESMVLDAVARMKRDQVDLDRLPDTGNLRDDLLGLFRPQSTEEAERKLKVMAGLASMISQHRTLADAGSDAVVEPWAAAHRTLIQRAVDRGEVSADTDVETASQVIPSMAAYRALIQRKSFDREFLISLVDGVLLPALGIKPKKTRQTNG